MLTAIAIPALTVGAVMAYGTFVPQSSLWCRVVSHGPRTGAHVAMTFDDGPWPDSTPAILDILAAERAVATFFVIGRNAVRWPSLLSRIAAEGHVIGNHSFDHDHFGIFRLRRYWQDQLERTDDAILKSTGSLPAFFRPPMGFKTGHLAAAVRRSRLAAVSWSRRAMDGVRAEPDRIVRRLARAEPGDILALHDGVEPHASRDPRGTIDALPHVLAALRGRGLEPVGLDLLLGHPATRRVTASRVE